jgi:hypothetical protein
MATGTIIYEPKIMASGKTRRAIIRRHAHNIFIETTRYLPILTGKLLKSSRKFIEAYKENPFYWISRGNSAVGEDTLDELLKLAKAIPNLSQNSDAPNYIDPTYIVTALKIMENDMIIKSKTNGETWCILKVDLKTIQEQLEGLRTAGVNISGSAWGPHVSVIRAEKIDPEIWAQRPDEGKLITFELGNLRHNKNGYYWYDIESRELELFRIQHGLSPRPTPPFHLTIGKVQ